MFALGTAALVGGTLAYTHWVEPHWVGVTRRDLPLLNLPHDLVGRTLVHITDLHAGRLVSSDYLIACLRKVRSLKPDLIAVTGDFMTCHRGEEVDTAVRVIAHLPPAPLGCFAVLGNHDYGADWAFPDVADRLVRRLTDLGVTVLRNEHRIVAGLQVVGLDDLWANQFEPAAVLPRLDAARPTVVLCHNPDAVDRPGWEGVRGWILAGHTHGGQCKPPFLPPPILPVVNRRYTSGAFDLGDGRRMYINRGLGYLRKVRFNAPPEITAFRLVRAAP